MCIGRRAWECLRACARAYLCARFALSLASDAGDGLRRSRGSVSAATLARNSAARFAASRAWWSSEPGICPLSMLAAGQFARDTACDRATSSSPHPLRLVLLGLSCGCRALALRRGFRSNASQQGCGATRVCVVCLGARQLPASDACGGPVRSWDRGRHCHLVRCRRPRWRRIAGTLGRGRARAHVVAHSVRLWCAERAWEGLTRYCCP